MPLSTGGNTFVGNEPVGIRLTFNEPITVPRVTVTQTGGTAQPLTPVAPPPGRTNKFTFQFQPFAVDAQNGPAEIQISGRNVGTNSPQDPGEGTDEAGNGVTPDNQNPIRLPGAFIVDTFAPDLRRELSVRQQTSPFEGQVVCKDKLADGYTKGLLQLKARLENSPLGKMDPEKLSQQMHDWKNKLEDYANLAGDMHTLSSDPQIRDGFKEPVRKYKAMSEKWKEQVHGFETQVEPFRWLIPREHQ